MYNPSGFEPRPSGPGLRRGGEQGLDYIGSHEQLEQEAWVVNSAQGQPHAVRSRRANPWGLYDVHGNIGESCQDDFDPERLARMLGKPAPAGGLLRIAAGSSYVSRIRQLSAALNPHATLVRHEHDRLSRDLRTAAEFSRVPS